MSDQALISYAYNLGAEVELSTQGEAECVCSEEEFTRIVLEKLADEGILDNPSLLYQQGSFGRVKYKITGFSISDTEDRILLATTVYSGELPPRRLVADEIRSALTHAVNFYKCSCDGLHEKIEPSNSEASDLAPYSRCMTRLTCSKWCCSPTVIQGLVPLMSGKRKTARVFS